MQRIGLDVTLGALEIAGSLSGIPFAGAAATFLEQIIQSCQEVVTHKHEARRLMDKCTRIWNALPEKLHGQDLRDAVDELEMVFGRIQRRAHQWSQYNRVTAWLKNGEIGKGLEQCQHELDVAITQLNIKFQAALHDGQKEVMDVVRSNREEMRELLLQVITTQADLQRIAEQQRNGEHVAEPFMAAGQEELRLLRQHREQKLLVATDRSLSPVSLSLSDSQRYLEFQRGLIQLHKSTGIPPTVKRLDGEVKKTEELAVAGGTYSDVWKGVWLGQKKVALKALRNIKASDQKAQKRFQHEIEVWAALQHEHILPFYGVVTNIGQTIHMVSPWQDNGNVLDYVKTHSEADRMRLIWGAADGLRYLHSRGIVHGNVKCANILVSKNAEARICDFGMSKIVEEVTEKSASATLTESGSARWLAPELIEGAISSPTLAADTYSYAMAVLELLTGKHPFADRKRDASVIHDIVVLKKTPQRPRERDVTRWLTDGLWQLMQSCWHSNAESRPSMSYVASEIRNMMTTV